MQAMEVNKDIVELCGMNRKGMKWSQTTQSLISATNKLKKMKMKN
jgi:hypothetical protein